LRIRILLALPMSLLLAGCAGSGPSVQPTVEPSADPQPVAAVRKTSVPAATPRPEETYEKAKAAEARGDHDEALQRWADLHRQDPNFKDTGAHLAQEYTVRGLDHFSRGELATAIRYWEKAQAVAPDDARIRAYLDRAREERDFLADLPPESETPVEAPKVR
jgi:tetratricopeptide (TPR) repeat protein